MTQKGTRYGFAALFLSLAFTLICSGSIFAQDFPDLLNYNLNGNNAPGTVFNSSTTSGGEIFRGDAASYNPSGFVAPCSSNNASSIPSCQGSATTTSISQCSYILTALYGGTVTATVGTYTGGYLLCTAAVGSIASSGNWAFAGDWTNYYAFYNNKQTLGAAQSEILTRPASDPTTNPYVLTEQCMDCHHYSVTAGPSYLLTGHKNGFRKIISGQPLHSSDGSTYTGINWSAVPPTTTAGVPVYYNIAGWMTPGAAPDLNHVQGGSAGCAYCHVSGYNPVAPSTASLWGGTNGATGTMTFTSGTSPTTYPGPEPTQVLPVTGVTITGVSIAAAGLQAPVVFTTSVAPPATVATNAYIQVNGFTTATGAPLNGTTFQVSGVSGTTITATSTIPYSYYLAGTSTTETGNMTVLSPLPQNSTGVLLPPENASSGFSSWYLTGVTCERCHVAAEATSIANTTTLQNNCWHTSGGSVGTCNASIANPTIPSGQGATELCMECHRLQVVSSKGVSAITPLYPPVVKYSASTGAYSDGDYQGSEFLNSPHAQYLGTLNQNAQGTTDLSLDFTGAGWTGTGTYYSLFTGVNLLSGSTDVGKVNDNSGCTGCHDPHQTIVGSEYTGGPLASAPIAIQNANLLQPLTYAAKAATGVGNVGTNSNLNWGALSGSGTVPAYNCNNCHGAAGPGEPITTFTHSGGPGTPFPNSTTSISPLDLPGACMVCHMEGSSGQPKMHFFRINPDANYYTYNTSGNYNATAAISAYAVSGTSVTFTTGAFTGATTAAAGDEITVSGITPAVLNNIYIATSFTPTSFTASVVPLGSPASITGLAGGSVTGTATISAVPYNTYTPADGEFTQASSTNTFIKGGNNAIGLDVDIACGQCHGGGSGNGVNPYGITGNTAPNFSRAYLASVAAGMHGTQIGPALAAPTFSPPAGSYTTTQTVTLNEATVTTPLATICYTTNGNTPTASVAGTCDSLLPDGQPNGELGVPAGNSITVASTESVRAIATAVGDLNSPLANATYTIGAAATVAAPKFSVNAGKYTLKTSTSTLTDVLTDATSGATICYTTNGGTPTASVAGTCDSQGGIEFGVASPYSLTISTSETVMAIGTHAGQPNSGVVSAIYTLIPAPPTFSPGTETFYQSYVSGSYPGVTLTSNTGATISYCTVAAGSLPCTPSTTYSAPFAVSCTAGTPPCGVIVFANAAFSGGTASSSSRATYSIKPGDPPGTPTAAIPTFSPSPGVITATESVSIADTSSPGPVTCYTLNGAVPSPDPTTSWAAGNPACKIGTLYTGGAIPLNAVQGTITTIRAVAGGAGYLHSAVGKGEYIYR